MALLLVAMGCDQAGSKLEAVTTTTSQPNFGAKVAELPASGTGTKTGGRTTATGLVVGADGNPAPGVRVEFRKESGSVLGAFGCLLGCPGLLGEQLTGSDGRFVVDSAGVNDIYSLSASNDAGAFVTAHISAPADSFQIPPLRLWDAHTSIVRADNTFQVSYDKLPDTGVGKLHFYSLAIVVEEPNQRVNELWRDDVIGATATFDPRMLEDFAAKVIVRGWTAGTAGQTSVDLRFSSPAIAAPRLTARPMSRDLPCAVSEAGTIMHRSPCALTDGVLADEMQVGQHSRVTIDLGRVLPSADVVLRGCVVTCSFGVSHDGERFRASRMPSGDGDTTVQLGVQRVRFIRLDGYDAGLRELSIWPSA